MNPDSKSEVTLKTRLRAETKRAILEAAEGLLGDRGPAQMRMEDVAARAGVSVGTIYNHVGDRRALVDAVLDAQRAELLARIDGALAHADEAPFAEVLEAFIAGVLAHFDAHLSLFRLLIEDELAPGGAERKRSAMRLLNERAARLMDVGALEGALDANDRELNAAFLMDMMRGLLVRTLLGGLDGHTDGLSALAPRTAQFFLQGAARVRP